MEKKENAILAKVKASYGGNMSPENFVFWLMGFLNENPCKEIKENKRDNYGSGMSVHQYKEILKALDKIQFK